MSAPVVISIEPNIKSASADFEIEKIVKSLLKDNPYVVFERQCRLFDMTVIKIIDRWEPDDLGDLEAVYTKNASTPYICPGDRKYIIRLPSIEEFEWIETGETNDSNRIL